MSSRRATALIAALLALCSFPALAKTPAATPAPAVTPVPAASGCTAIALAAADAGAVQTSSAADAWGGPRTAAAATLSDRVVGYSIDAELDPDKHTVTGRQQLTWRNRSAQPV